jgi:hypothetical protein
MSIHIGDRFVLAEENIAGVVSDTFYNDCAELAAIVVKQDDVTWAAVDMSLVVPRVVH